METWKEVVGLDLRCLHLSKENVIIVNGECDSSCSKLSGSSMTLVQFNPDGRKSVCTHTHTPF